MGRADEHFFHRQAGRLARIRLRAVDEVALHHARIHHAQHDTRLPVIQCQRLRRERIRQLVGRELGEHAVHPHGKFLRPDVRRECPGAKLGDDGSRNQN